jgi:hypothetical protein
MSGWWFACVVVAVVTASTACSSDAATVPDTTGQPSPPATSHATGATESPRDAAIAAYEAYTAATVKALAAGDEHHLALAETAADDALEHARRRVRANAAESVVTTGDLEPSVTAEQVVLDNGGRSATLTDCVLNGLEQVSADDSDEVVAEATGWRQPVVATVEQRDSGWVVTAIETPIEDGSGTVPSPPTDPPFLRGPAQTIAPPSCVPPDIASAAVDAYLAFHEAYNTALGIARGGAADPQLPALPDVAIAPQLGSARKYLNELAAKDHAVRGEPDARDPWAVSARDFDRSVILYDCVTLADNRIVEADSGDVIAQNDVGLIRLDGGEVRRIDGRWKVASWEIIEEGLEECTSSASS